MPLHLVPFAASLLLLLSASCPTPARSAEPAAQPLRVMTYNIHHGEGRDGRLDIARIAGIIKAQKPDLVAVQEVDVRTTRAPIDEPAELARLTGMHVSFGKAIDLQGGSYGQVILSRYPLSDARTIRLPSQPKKEQRVAHSVLVTPAGGQAAFRFVTVHLDHQSNDDRVRQATALLEELSRDDTPTILAGDFNATADSPPMERVFTRFDDAAGKAATNPTGASRRIDHIVISKQSPWRVVALSVVDEPVASDHRPVVADLAWKESRR